MAWDFTHIDFNNLEGLTLFYYNLFYKNYELTRYLIHGKGITPYGNLPTNYTSIDQYAYYEDIHAIHFGLLYYKQSLGYPFPFWDNTDVWLTTYPTQSPVNIYKNDLKVWYHNLRELYKVVLIANWQDIYTDEIYAGEV